MKIFYIVSYYPILCNIISYCKLKKIIMISDHTTLFHVWCFSNECRKVFNLPSRTILAMIVCCTLMSEKSSSPKSCSISDINVTINLTHCTVTKRRKMSLIIGIITSKRVSHTSFATFTSKIFSMSVEEHSKTIADEILYPGERNRCVV